MSDLTDVITLAKMFTCSDWADRIALRRKRQKLTVPQIIEKMELNDKVGTVFYKNATAQEQKTMRAVRGCVPLQALGAIPDDMGRDV